MSKAVLIMDMPDCCSGCDVCLGPGFSHDGYVCCIPDEAGNERAYEDGDYSKPEWCPLRELPEKMPTYLCINNEKGYCEGHNDCIDAITGESEEK